jgi:hypothetical protein
LKQIGKKHQLGEDMISALKDFEKHIKHMAYANSVDMKLPIGFGQADGQKQSIPSVAVPLLSGTAIYFAIVRDSGPSL